MRLVNGGDLSSLVRRTGPLAPDQTAGFISAVASALDAAHAIGLVHRDIKPGNMLLDSASGLPDHVYLSDFGLTKSTESGTALTATGSFMGTPDYVAPEQISGKRVDGRTDQYALACVAVYLLTAHPPYQRAETVALLWAHMQDPPPSLSALRPELPPAVDEVIARAMAKSPDERYATCGQFAAALQQAVSAPTSTSAGMATGTGTRPMNSPPYGTVISRHSAPSGGASQNWAGQATSHSPAPATQASAPSPRAPVPAMPDPRPAVPVAASPKPAAPQPAPYEPLRRTAVGLDPSRSAVERSGGGPSGIPLRPILIGAGVVVVLLVLWLLTSH
jgi:serine/threonine-protein kinase